MIRGVNNKIKPFLSAVFVLFFAIIIGLTFIVPITASAAAPAAGTPVGVCPDGGNDCAGKKYVFFCEKGAKDCNGYINDIYGYALKLGVVLTVLMIIYAGYLYLFSQGDSSKINSGREILLGSLLGFILLLTVGLILDFIGLPSI